MSDQFSTWFEDAPVIANSERTGEFDFWFEDAPFIEAGEGTDPNQRRRTGQIMFLQ